MSLRNGNLVEVEITDIAFGGKGLARIDGMAVFVEQAVPGDQVEIQIVKRKKNFAEARVIRLIHPSPDRVPAPCPYSGFCGGCTWQFLSYDRQLDYKRRHVVESLAHIGHLADVCVHSVIASDATFGYRNKMEFTCSDRRWLLPSELQDDTIDRNFAIGLHVPGTFHKVLDTRACLLQPGLGNQILADVRGFIRHCGLPVYGLRSHKGFWRFVVLRHSAVLDRWMVNLVTTAEDPGLLQSLAQLLMDRYPQVVSVVNNVTSRKAGVAIGEYERLVAGTLSIVDTIGRFEFEISANSFFQTNTFAAAKLYGVVKEFSALTGREAVLDLYSGTGTIPIYLADSANEVLGIEIVPSAVDDAEKNCRRNAVSNCRFVLGDTRQHLQGITTPPDVLIIDPPRAGMHQDVVRQVEDMAPARVIYISCNPATLARDLSLLKSVYHVVEVQPVDMFPHTYHVESVAKLEKRRRPL
jgi:23S rRNA (uracil1939-C5)-methyltransferase